MRVVLCYASIVVVFTIWAPALSQGEGARYSSAVNQEDIKEYCGIYQWGANQFVYLQLWSEFTATNQLVAFDESGEVRVLYPASRDRFFTGPGVAISSSVESHIEFNRDANKKITSIKWQRGGVERTARRVEIEKREDVRFVNHSIQLEGTLISPNTPGKHPAIILVHASGAEDREYLLPFAHFLVHHGMSVLGYDKRGVGASAGDWKTSSFEDLAGDVVAAFQYLKTREDIDSLQIGLLGWSQAGWVMPIAATRTNGIAFLVSISGAGLPAAETTIDEAQSEMTASGLKPALVEQIISLMRLQYRYAQTDEGWDQYSAAREQLAGRMGRPPSTFPGTREDPYWQFLRASYFYDPAPTLRKLNVPTLALFGERDTNILAAKNKAAWGAALKAARNRDYTLQIIPSANHLMLEARIGTNGEMPSLRRFVPAYFVTVEEWLAKRVRNFRASPDLGTKVSALPYVLEDVFGQP